MMRLLLLVAALALLPAAAAEPPEAGSAEALTERMLEALGGRAAWAGASGTINDSQQNRTGEPAELRSVITMDFTRPRFRIENRAPGFFSERVVDGERSWRRTSAGLIEDLPADFYAEEMRWYGAHLYRSLHRIAARDPALAYRLGADGRLEVLEDGVRLIWLRLDARGEPYAFGQWDDETGSICGPWTFEAGGLRHPAWVSSPDGTWRAAIKALSVSPALPDALFARPAD